MARTKQTARKSTGGKAPRKQAYMAMSGRKNPASEKLQSSSMASIEFCERFALAGIGTTEREEVVDCLLVRGSAWWAYYRSLCALDKVHVAATLQEGESVLVSMLEFVKVLRGSLKKRIVLRRRLIRHELHVRLGSMQESIDRALRDAANDMATMLDIKVKTGGSSGGVNVVAETSPASHGDEDDDVTMGELKTQQQQEQPSADTDNKHCIASQDLDEMALLARVAHATIVRMVRAAESEPSSQGGKRRACHSNMGGCSTSNTGCGRSNNTKNSFEVDPMLDAQERVALKAIERLTRIARHRLLRQLLAMQGTALGGMTPEPAFAELAVTLASSATDEQKQSVDRFVCVLGIVVGGTGAPNIVEHVSAELQAKQERFSGLNLASNSDTTFRPASLWRTFTLDQLHALQATYPKVLHSDNFVDQVIGSMVATAQGQSWGAHDAYQSLVINHTLDSSSFAQRHATPLTNDPALLHRILEFLSACPAAIANPRKIRVLYALLWHGIINNNRVDSVLLQDYIAIPRLSCDWMNDVYVRSFSDQTECVTLTQSYSGGFGGGYGGYGGGGGGGGYGQQVNKVRAREENKSMWKLLEPTTILSQNGFGLTEVTADEDKTLVIRSITDLFIHDHSHSIENAISSDGSIAETSQPGGISSEQLSASMSHMLRTVLDTTTLDRVKDRALILAGKLDERDNIWAPAVLSSAQVTEIRTCVEMAFTADNPSLFRAGQGVEMSVELMVRNIESVVVNVYIVDTVRLCHEGSESGSLKPFNKRPGNNFWNVHSTDWMPNLQGMVPHEQISISVDPSQIGRRSSLKITIPTASADRRGVFVADVIGVVVAGAQVQSNHPASSGSKLSHREVRCRAILRKGALRVSHRVVNGGHEIHVFDEEGVRVPVDQLSVAIVNRRQAFSGANDTTAAAEDSNAGAVKVEGNVNFAPLVIKGADCVAEGLATIMIPFQNNVSTVGKLVVTIQNEYAWCAPKEKVLYSSGSPFSTPNDEADFFLCGLQSACLEADMHLDSEQLVPGLVGKVIIAPRLVLYDVDDIPIDLSSNPRMSLKSVKVHVCEGDGRRMLTTDRDDADNKGIGGIGLRAFVQHVNITRDTSSLEVRLLGEITISPDPSKTNINNQAPSSLSPAVSLHQIPSNTNSDSESDFGVMAMDEVMSYNGGSEDVDNGTAVDGKNGGTIPKVLTPRFRRAVAVTRTFSTASQTWARTHLYLSRDKITGSVYIMALGRNGEPVSGAIIDCWLSHPTFGGLVCFKGLETDDLGLVSLGDLCKSGVVRVWAKLQGNYDTWNTCYNSDKFETRSDDTVRKKTEKETTQLMARTVPHVDIRDILSVDHTSMHTSKHTSENVDDSWSMNNNNNNNNMMKNMEDEKGVSYDVESVEATTQNPRPDIDVSTGLFSWPVPKLVSFSHAGVGLLERMQTLGAKAIYRTANVNSIKSKNNSKKNNEEDEEDEADKFCEFGESFQSWCMTEESKKDSIPTLVLGVGDKGNLLVPITYVQPTYKQEWTPSQSEFTMRLVEQPRVETGSREVVSAMRVARLIRDGRCCTSEDVTEWLTRPDDRIGVWYFTPQTPGKFAVCINDSHFKVYVYGNTKSMAPNTTTMDTNTAMDMQSNKSDRDKNHVVTEKNMVGIGYVSTDVDDDDDDNKNNNDGGAGCCLLLNNLLMRTKKSQFTAALALRSVDATLNVKPGEEGLTLRVQVVGASERCEVHAVSGRLVSPGSSLAQALFWRAYSPDVEQSQGHKQKACSNVYGDASTLDGESAYVLARRRDPARAGSLLTKSAPSLLVYPTLTRGSKIGSLMASGGCGGEGTAAANGYNVLQRLQMQDPRQQCLQQRQRQSGYANRSSVMRSRNRQICGGGVTSGRKRAPTGFLSSPSFVTCASPTQTLGGSASTASINAKTVRVADVHLPATNGSLLADLLHRVDNNNTNDNNSLGGNGADRGGLEVTILVTEWGQRTVQCQLVLPVPALVNLLRARDLGANTAPQMSPLCVTDLTGPTRDVRLSRAEALGVEGGGNIVQHNNNTVGVPGKHHYVEFKRAITLMHGETAQLAQQDTSKVCIYNNMAEAFDAMERVLPSGNELVPVHFLRRWSRFSMHAKLRYLAALPCDELRFFVMRKDPVLFRERVEMNVKARHVKSFMDLYLTQDLYALRGEYFNNPSAFASLSVAEKLMLAESLGGDTGIRICRAVISLIESSFRKAPRVTLRDMFGAVLDGVQAVQAVQESDTAATADDSDSVAGSGDEGSSGDSGDESDDGGDSTGVPLEGMHSLTWMNAKYNVQDANDADSGSDEDTTGSSNAAYGIQMNSEERFNYPRVRNSMNKSSGCKSKSHKGAAKEQRYVLAAGAKPSSPNSFWCDWAKHLMANIQQQQQQVNTKASSFLSVHFVEATSCFTEAMLALSLLDLPLQSTQHKDVLHNKSETAQVEVGERGEEKLVEGLTTITATNEPMLVYYQDMDAQLADSHYASVAGAGLIVTQTIFDKDAFVTGENAGSGSSTKDNNGSIGGVLGRAPIPVRQFFANRVYTLRCTVSNVEARANNNLSLLLQVPEGAIPLGQENIALTRSIDFDLGGNENEIQNVSFYFPNAGVYFAYPAHLAKNDKLIGWASNAAATGSNSSSTSRATSMNGDNDDGMEESDNAITWSPDGTWIRLNVIESLTEIPVDVRDWEDVATRGSVEDILQYLQHPSSNVYDIKLAALVPRLTHGDANTYSSIMDVLRTKLLVFDRELCKLAFVHADVKCMRDWLSQDNLFQLVIGPGLADCPLLCESANDDVGAGGSDVSAVEQNTTNRQLGAHLSVPVPGGLLGEREYHELCDFVRSRVHGSGPWQQRSIESGNGGQQGRGRGTQEAAELQRMELWYHRYMADLCLLPKTMVATHSGIKMQLALFWVALGRIAEALAVVAQIRQLQEQSNSGGSGSGTMLAIAESMQLDFLDAYLDFHREYPVVATESRNKNRFVVARHVAREWAGGDAEQGFSCAPVWKARFAALKEELRRLDELDTEGKSICATDDMTMMPAPMVSLGVERNSVLRVESEKNEEGRYTTSTRCVVRVRVGSDDIAMGRTCAEIKVFAVDMEMQFVQSPFETTYLWTNHSSHSSASSSFPQESESNDNNRYLTSTSGNDTDFAKRAAMLRTVVLGMAPVHTVDEKVSSDARELVFEMPANLQHTSLVVSASLYSPKEGAEHGAPQLIESFAPRDMRVSVDRTTGIVNVVDANSGRPVPAAYVKCFRKQYVAGGMGFNSKRNSAFHRDGYTNVLGEVGVMGKRNKSTKKKMEYEYMVLVMDPRKEQNGCVLMLVTL